MASRAARDVQLQAVTVEQHDRVLTARMSDPPFNFMTVRI